MERNNIFGFIKFCNERLTNSNEYNIARVIISHFDNIKSVSQETIANEANISVASVSRFINKAGFDSFQDFKYKVEIYNKDTKMRRILEHTMRFMRTSLEDMADNLYDDAINNLHQTKLNLDLDKLKQISKRLKNSHSVMIIGDSHELNDFYTYQLDLLINGIPSYLINVAELEKAQINNLNQDDSILYLDMYEGWFSDGKRMFLQKMKERNVYIIAFCQETSHLQDYADLIYVYGINQSNNNGYYSLPYLSRLLSEIIYHNF